MKTLGQITLIVVLLFAFAGSDRVQAALLPQSDPPQLESVEPQTVSNTAPTTLSIRGSGFIATTLTRLVGYGLLDTTYVSESWVRAVLPAGVPAGQYELEVINDTLTSNRVSLQVTGPQPTPTPAPTPAPPPAPAPGRPILTVRNFSVEPTRVRPGQEFVVTIEIYNNGSRAGENTMAVFTGGSFVPVGENGHMIWTLHINHTAVISQRMRAPANIGAGIHQLAIDLSANDFAGEHYDYPTMIPVEVIGGTTGVAAGRPRVVVETATTTPAVLVPGEPFSLTLRLANRGNFSALNVLVTAASADMATTAAGSDTVAVSRIGVNEAVTVTLPLVLADVEQGGRQNLELALEYGDHTGAAHSDRQNVGVDLDTSLANRPQLLIETYRTTPAQLYPGDSFTLTIELTNVGGGDAQRVTLALGGAQGESLEPFFAAGAGNVLFIARVGRGETVTIVRQLFIDGSATPKAYNLPVEVAYDDARGTRQSAIQRLSLVVYRRVDLEPRFYRAPGRLTVGQPATLEIEVVNLGRSAVHVASMTARSPHADVRLTGTPFSGPLDSNGAAPLDLELTPRQAGPVELTLVAAYRDDFNRIQELSWTLTLQVDEAAAPALPGETGQSTPEPPPTTSWWQQLWRVVRGLLGLGS